jgi:hypothetical protein
MKNDLIYLYCVTDTLPFPGQSIESHGLESIEFNNFYMIVRHVPYSEFSEVNLKLNLSDVHWREAMAFDHINVIKKVMEYNTVIPFKLGTIFDNDESLRNYIKNRTGSVRENFIQIRGKEEWVLKIYCNCRKLSEQIDEMSEVAVALEEKIMASSPGRAYLLERKKTEFVDAEMERLLREYGQSYFDNFKILSESAQLNPLVPDGVTGRPDRMILNASFLVDKDKVAIFKSTASSIRKSDGDSGIVVETFGPCPPYSFVALNEKKVA